MAEAIRAGKRAGNRPRPSQTMLDTSAILSSKFRTNLVDRAAELVDENLFGRSDMCRQFAILVARGLNALGVSATPISGVAQYYVDDSLVHSWPHVWVRAGNEAIDANVDSLYENPTIPHNIKCRPYWGPIKSVPRDRRLRASIPSIVEPDPDVDSIWWPELSLWVSEQKK